MTYGTVAGCKYLYLNVAAETTCLTIVTLNSGCITRQHVLTVKASALSSGSFALSTHTKEKSQPET